MKNDEPIADDAFRGSEAPRNIVTRDSPVWPKFIAANKVP